MAHEIFLFRFRSLAIALGQFLPCVAAPAKRLGCGEPSQRGGETSHGFTPNPLVRDSWLIHYD